MSGRKLKSWQVLLIFIQVALTLFQRKVKFPVEYDALDLASDELKEKLLPVSRRLKEITNGRLERRKVRKRTKAPAAGPSVAESRGTLAAPVVSPSSDEVVAQAETNVDLLPEPEYRVKEKAELEALVDEGIKADIGSSWTGLYELVGE